MHEPTQELLEILARDAADWEKAAEDMDYVAPLLADESHRRSALARAACYREHALRDRAVVRRTRQELTEKEKVVVLP